MAIKRFVNRYTILEADLNPTPQVVQPIKLEELDTGNVYKSDGSALSVWQGPVKIETLTNKNIPVEDNEFINFDTVIDHPFLKNFEQKGYVIPASTVADSFHNLLSNPVLHNANAVKVDTGNGVIAAFQSLVDDEKLGFNSPVTIARRDKGYEVKAEIRSNAQTVLLGFSTANAFDPASIFGSTDKGVAIGWTLASPWICTYNHDGSGAVITTPSAIGKGITFHTLEIILSTANIRCIIDGAQTLTLNTNIPGLTDNLYLLSYGIH